MQRCYQKFICKVKQNFRESTTGIAIMVFIIDEGIANLINIIALTVLRM